MPWVFTIFDQHGIIGARYKGGTVIPLTSKRGEVAGMTLTEVLMLLTLLSSVVFGVLNLTLKK